MKPKHLLTLLPLIALLTGCGQNQVNIPGSQDQQLAGVNLTATPAELVVYPNDTPSIPDGKPVFATNCASCHGATGSGGSATVGFDQQWSRQVKPIDMYRLVAFGYIPGHPKYGDAAHKPHQSFSEKLSVRDLWNVVLYTKSLGQPALSDEEIATLDPVFGSNCAVCHGTKGDGDGPLARNLEPMPANFQRFDRFFNRTDDVLFDHIANGIRWEGMPNFLGKKDSKKNVKFDEPFIRKLVQYVHKFHVNNSPVLTANAAAPTGAGLETGATGTQQATSAPPPQGAANAGSGNAANNNNSTSRTGKSRRRR